MAVAGQAGRAETWSALCLVAGCCIGGGMLAFPVAMGINGFIPSLAVMAICWLCMTLSALLLLEVSLWMEEGAHVVTMTSRLLGRVGCWISWCLYLFVCYASLVAYTAGAGAQMVEWWNHVLGVGGVNTAMSLFFLALFLLVIYFGGQSVGSVNSLLFAIMVVAYCLLVATGASEMRPSFLMFSNWKGIWSPIPLLLTAFSFQTMVPSLTPLLKRDPKALRFAIVGGTTLALIIYAIWQALILGVVPVEGEMGLRKALERGVPATLFLREHVEAMWVVWIAEFFGFFAIATSFLAIGLGLWDFLADGLQLKKEGWNKWLLFLLIALPVGIGATQFERIFYIALDTTGGFGDTVLNGLFPVMMVWIGRYHVGHVSEWRLPGGKSLLVAIFLCFAIALLLECAIQGGWISNPQEPYDVVEIYNQEQI